MSAQIQWLVAIFLITLGWMTHYNAREAHRHTHELACHVGADELCSWHHKE